MGCSVSKEKQLSDEVDLSHFIILRSIGRGSFGKVCIVKKKDSEKTFAMKYVNKKLCLEQRAVRNVCREQQILMALRHPFLVNLWYTFQDHEDLFMVVELLTGGDLRFHIDSKNVIFDKHTLKVYALSIGLALDYLRSKGVVHRDIKPDNILLDDHGHIAITDFNVAEIISSDKKLQSVAGTKSYMAPEMFEAGFCRRSKGYSFEVDWWATGVTLYETFQRRLPFDFSGQNKWEEYCNVVKKTHVKYGPNWDADFAQVISSLLQINPNKRTSNCDKLGAMNFFGNMRKEEVLNKLVRPTFIPSDKKFNCEATYEFEEKIIEAEPLHQKKKRLKSISGGSDKSAQNDGFEKFVNFNRLKEWNNDIELGDETQGSSYETTTQLPNLFNTSF